MKKIDLTGKRFGKLVCLKVCEESIQRTWICKCDCGNISKYPTFEINSGKILHCRSVWHTNIIQKGDVFGYLTVIDISQNYSSKRQKYVCSCICGNLREVYARYLQRGSVTHCGCKRDLSKLGKPKGIAGFNKVLSNYKGNARSRNLPFLLTENECKKLFLSNCHYCGEPPSLLAKTRKKDFYYNGIDRMNSELGYTNDNCVSCCKECNYLKSKIPYKDFINKIIKIYQHVA